MPSHLQSLLYSQFLHTPPLPTTPLTSQTYIITGSNTGVGLAAARHVARLGASRIIIAVRSASKGEAALQDLIQSTGRDPKAFEVWPLDLSSAESIKKFGERVRGLERLDAVIQNAGILTQNFKTVEGLGRSIESHIAINSIAAVMVGFEVLPKLRESAKKYGTKGRLTFVGSDLYMVATFPEYGTIEKEGKSMMEVLADPTTAVINDRYATSKLLLMLSIRAMAQQSPLTSDSPVVINVMSPGACKTDIFRDDFPSLFVRIFMGIGMRVMGRTAEVGGRTLVNAVDPDMGDEAHGRFVWDVVREPTALVESKKGREMQDKWQKELWGLLEKLHPGITQI